MRNPHRRQFLKSGVAAGFLAGTGALGCLTAQRAYAANTNGYKALVGIFLKGGLDSADAVIPTDAASYDLLRAARPGLMNAYGVGSGSSSRDRNNLLTLNAENYGDFGSRRLGLPPELSGMRGMFESGEMAIVGNVGPLIEPIDRDGYESRSGRAPDRLYSHNDQQSVWMSLGFEGTRFGWGGKFVDAALMSDRSLNPLYASVTASQPDVFLSGDAARAFTVRENGGQKIQYVDEAYRLGYDSRFDATRQKIDAFLRKQSFDETNLFAVDYAARSAQGVENTRAIDAALQSAAPITTTFPSTGLGRQLKAIANTINIRGTLNSNRQVFYSTLGGFDSHSGQAASVPNRLAEISDAVSAFRSAMLELGTWNDVAVFTMSDFGRTLIDNGDGTDHGWGAHHFVMGGSVAGKRLYGDFPQADLGGPRFTKSRGRLIPDVSVEQYAATLGRWFGLDEGELAAALPNLQNFNQKNVGFFGGTGT